MHRLLTTRSLTSTFVLRVSLLVVLLVVCLSLVGDAAQWLDDMLNAGRIWLDNALSGM